jgi:hypothetical protein
MLGTMTLRDRLLAIQHRPRNQGESHLADYPTWKSLVEFFINTRAVQYPQTVSAYQVPGEPASAGCVFVCASKRRGELGMEPCLRLWVRRILIAVFPHPPRFSIASSPTHPNGEDFVLGEDSQRRLLYHYPKLGCGLCVPVQHVCIVSYNPKVCEIAEFGCIDPVKVHRYVGGN